MHIKDLKNRLDQLKEGSELIDDSDLHESQYKMVMIGRKISKEEQQTDSFLSHFEAKHNLSADVFHESAQKFDQATLKGEGVARHYLRNLHLPVLLVIGIGVGFKLYTWSFT